MNAIFHRTSVRRFEDKPVETEKVDLLLKAAMQAPSACNQQPWEFYVVTNPEKIGALSQTSPYAGPCKAAPLAIVICGKQDAQLSEYVSIDLAIATENLMLEADTLGLGSVMLGIAPVPERMEAVRQVLSIPETLIPFTIVPVGYPLSVKAQQDRFDSARIHYVD